MWETPHSQELGDGRLHLQHGPIDVVLKAWGCETEVAAARHAATRRFASILTELVGELDELRLDMARRPRVTTPVAMRMTEACAAFPDFFVTPMAAVSGAVADELIAVMTGAARLDKAFVNDGGDVAIYLDEGQSLSIGVVGDFTRFAVPQMHASLELVAGQPVRGIATSGAQGRSFSLGISDSITVLAQNAALADAAATLIANAVDMEHPQIVRRPACDLDPDSDLEGRLVTGLVPPLTAGQIAGALGQGLDLARVFRARGLIADAALSLQGQTITLGAALQAIQENRP